MVRIKKYIKKKGNSFAKEESLRQDFLRSQTGPRREAPSFHAEEIVVFKHLLAHVISLCYCTNGFRQQSLQRLHRLLILFCYLSSPPEEMEVRGVFSFICPDFAVFLKSINKKESEMIIRDQVSYFLYVLFLVFYYSSPQRKEKPR